MIQTADLKRSLTLPLLILYGIGTIVGAGIYVLIGKVAGAAGPYTVYAFLLAGLVAGLMAFTYAELSSRLPKSAGESVYVMQAFGHAGLARLTGWAVVMTGIVSSATMARGFVGYFHVFLPGPDGLLMVGFVVCLMLVALWGIRESVALIALVTLVEVGGLVGALGVASTTPPVLDWSAVLMPPVAAPAASGIMLGAFLAFYAFIGFEDMVNVAEEVKNPRRTLPIAILVVILLATVLYVCVGALALRYMPIEALAQSAAPFAELVAASGYSPLWISAVSLVAVINGTLVQMIMASRVLYGMGRSGLAPEVFGRVHPKRQTPAISTGVVTAAVLMFALALPLVRLAELTSFIILAVFTLISVALIRLKRLNPDPAGVVTVPLWLPVLSAGMCLWLLGWQVVG